MTDAAFDTALDPLGFVVAELAARGALVERELEGRAVAVLPDALARTLAMRDEIAICAEPMEGAVSCALGAPLLDRLVTDVRAVTAVASVAWNAEPPRLPVAERLAERIVVRNGVADLLGSAHVSATYLAGVFAWSIEADDRYEGLAFGAAHASSGGEPEPAVIGAFADLVAGRDDRFVDQRDASGAAGAVDVLARRAAVGVEPHLDDIGTDVARRRDRERTRIDDYFTSMIAEARRPRGRVGRDAIEARVAALHAEHAAKLRDLMARYTLRIRLEPIALVAFAVRVAEVRVRLRRRKLDREVALHVPPAARMPDGLVCAVCASTTRMPLLCDDALHALCESCAPDATGRPHCPACRRRR